MPPNKYKTLVSLLLAATTALSASASPSTPEILNPSLPAQSKASDLHIQYSLLSTNPSLKLSLSDPHNEFSAFYSADSLRRSEAASETEGNPFYPLDNNPVCFDCHLQQYPCLNMGVCACVDLGGWGGVAGEGGCEWVGGQAKLAKLVREAHNMARSAYVSEANGWVGWVGLGGHAKRGGWEVCDSLATPDYRRPRAPDEHSCPCSGNWTGINCNICVSDEACGPLVPNVDPLNPPKCYSAVAAVKQNYLQCDVMNKNIVDVLEGKKPEITYSCNATAKTCNFQFWADEKESFFCGLEECNCGKMACRCYPGRLLCEKGGLDFSDWFLSDDPVEGGPRGPAKLECKETGPRERTCSFSEYYLDQVINQFFGDPNIKLSCPYAGECLHFSQVPGYVRPDLPTPYTPLQLTLIVLGAIALLGIVFFIIRWAAKKSDEDRLNLAYANADAQWEQEDEEGRRRMMMSHHVPSEIMFRDVGYVVERRRGKRERAGRWFGGGRGRDGEEEREEAVELGRSVAGDEEKLVVLDGVHGMVKSGEVLAIMGGSGAGKTTFLDILARRSKAGTVTGEILVNGKFMSDEAYRSIVGFVDQEDTLMDTLTVYETILYSALLRLPRTMSYAEKKRRVEETMVELGIEGIANRRVGKAGARGISGGEKRRVSIACELVTSPSILFLDEPTSGLDSYNAYNVIECLVSLARTYHRTIIFTIHQPRSNIYALFDQLVLLAKGKMVYSGPAQAPVIEHFRSMGFECPVGFNIADYLVDLTMHVISEDEQASATSPANGSHTNGTSSVISEEGGSESSTVITVQSPTKRPGMKRTPSIREQQENSLFTPRPHSAAYQNGTASGTHLEVSDATSPSGLVRKGRRLTIQEHNQMVDHLRLLVDGYAMSGVAEDIATEINTALETANTIPPIGEGQPILPTTSNGQISQAPSAHSLLSLISRRPDTTTRNYAHHRASIWTQFKILSGRTFKNLYRNPDLLRTHYIIAVLVALGLGVLFWRLDNTLAGFQNRMGVLFFVCAVFGFGCLSSMQVLFDLLPLRVVPPLLLTIIAYPMMGLRSESYSYILNFTLVLVLFNLTAASCCLAISIVFKDASMASLVAILVMLYEMLFGGLLLNKATMGPVVRSMSEGSFWNYAWEAMLGNEVNGLTLYDERLKLPIRIPGAVILQTFGLDPQGYWRDVERLAIMFGAFLLVAFLWLQFLVKERR
ncbi:hypothetical protein HDV00_002973 [Rhizophlyctis rosea]|nr:hypothetical protein HDV00_002973 [Rhizophlyctis rosea]